MSSLVFSVAEGDWISQVCRGCHDEFVDGLAGLVYHDEVGKLQNFHEVPGYD